MVIFSHVSRISFRGGGGGGVPNFSGKVGRFLVIVRFGVFWSTVSVNFLLRKYYNYLSNIDMVLLRTSYMYGDFLEYYFRLQFSAFWSTHDKTWISHITYVKNKISKGIGIMYKARRYLNKSIV